MLKTILTHGAIAGLVVAIPLFGLNVLLDGPPEGGVGMAIGYLTMLVAFTTIFLAIKRRRDAVQGGVIRFLPALGLGLGITLVASVLYAITWEIVLATGVDFVGQYSADTVARMRAAGAPEAEIAATQAELAAFAEQYADPLFRFAITLAEIFPIGLLVSLVSAGLLANRSFLAVDRTAAR
ncbi:DUF4199 domain-containing protein [Sphingosinithalassobacter sp. CS137]|uniref:DUF4199 domain-containing protein n=1 Tax=Sphingosinithalassobacter sp. CS137 TaxID=2762748 RepID=UPI00165D8BB0|nr:DUF4199 domain-containing protein [Sphingosinithalassobacter sp. CS137]